MAAKYSLTESQIRAGEILQDLIDGLANITVSAGSSINDLVDAGVLFIAGASASVSASNSTSIYIENPAGSGVTVNVIGFSAYNDATGAANVTFHKGVASSGATVAAFNPNLTSSNEANAIVKAGGTLSGGEELTPSINVVRDRSFTFDAFKIVLGEGDSAALQVAVPAGLSSQIIKRNVIWYES